MKRDYSAKAFYEQSAKWYSGLQYETFWLEDMLEFAEDYYSYIKELKKEKGL